MSEQVHLPNAAFEHDRLHLAPPNGLQGGAYFAMLYYKDAPLYIQTPKCASRQAVVPGKRPYIDLMFSSHDVSFLEWLEALETDVIRLIYEKRNMWISADLEKSDIEAGFTSPVRPYKGGKHYLIRAHIQPAKHLAGTQSCSVFDENERPVSIDHIKAEHQMYTVIEFQGIKFTSRSFQLEVSLKQVLLVSNVPMFQSCVIRKPSASTPLSIIASSNETDKQDENKSQSAQHATMEEPSSHESSREPSCDPIRESSRELSDESSSRESSSHESSSHESSSRESSHELSDESSSRESSSHESSSHESSSHDSSKTANTEHSPTIPPTTNASNCDETGSMQIQEVNLDVLEELEHMHLKLKKPTEVYYNLYRIAKQKAKELKKNAIAAHLEAKQIKSAHMLEDSESSESDDDFICNDE